MHAWFVALVVAPALGGEVLSYAHPASAVGDAWRTALEGRGVQVVGPDLGAIDAFAAVDAELRVSGRLGPDRVDGALRVRATGLTRAEVTPSLPWGPALEQAAAEVDAALARGRQTTDTLVRRELLLLRAPSTCRAALDALATSPWPEAVGVLQVGLDSAAEPCRGASPQPTRPCRADCCKVCDLGQACGDSCISRAYTCHKGRGCACNASEVCP